MPRLPNARRYLCYFVPLVLLGAGGLALIYYGEARVSRAVTEAEERRVVDLAARTITGELQSMISDLQFAAGQNELAALLRHDGSAERRMLAAEYRRFVAEKPMYGQLRFIDREGMEVVRAERVGRHAEIVPAQELQYKADRPYFFRALKLKPGQFYVSPLDLNIEHGMIEQPPKPMLRVATPVAGPDGRKRGVVVVNYLGRHLIDRLKALHAPGGDHLWLLNAQGYWLIGPRPEVEWAFMYPERAHLSFARANPAAWKRMNVRGRGQFYQAGTLFTYVRVYPLYEGLHQLIDAGADWHGVQRFPGVRQSWLAVTHVAGAAPAFGNRTLARLLWLAFLGEVLFAALVAWVLTHQVERRRKADLALREAKEQYAELVARLKVGLCRLDLGNGGRFVRADEAVRGIFEARSADALLRTGLAELFPSPEEWQDFTSHLNYVGALEGVETEVKTLTGRSFWVSITAHLDDAGRDGHHAEAILSDITERKQNERELRSSEERFRSLVEGSIQGIVIHRDFKALFANQAFADIWGFDSPEEMLALDSLLPLVAPEDRERVRAERADALRQRRVEPTFGTLSGTRKDGQRISLEWFSRAIDWDGAPANQITVIDVTQRSTLEAQLRQAQKMEVIGQLAGGIAHDFNNILQIIQGYTELALSARGKPERKTEQLGRVLQAAEGASSLTRQLLAFSRQTVLQPRNLDINELLARQMKMLGRLIGERITLEMIPGEGVGPIHADPGMLEQVFMNLCLNARDAMPDGGRLIIETRRFVADRLFCRVHDWAMPGEYVQVFVTDTGQGMASEVAEHVFEPFFTTKEAGKGTGLGLSMVYGIISQHKGAIRVYSEPGVGTTFRVYLPARQGEVAAVEEAQHLPVVGGTETLLVAEDHPNVLQLVVELMEDKGYRVLTASDGQEAVDTFTAHAGEIDLVILDVVMPKLSGREAFNEVRRIRPDVPVVLSTGYTANVVDQAFLSSARIPLVQKPYSPTELYRVVREALERGVPAPQGEPEPEAAAQRPEPA